MPALIELQHCRRTYDNGRIVALDDISTSVGRGELVAVTGPSGSGKSTFLDVMCGLEEPDRGTVLFNGTAMRGRAAWAKVRAAHIGFVFQSFFLIPSLTVSENVELAMLGGEAGRSARRQRVRELLVRLGLGERMAQYPLQLSGGQRQRVAIARALSNDPEMIVADEPTGSLDSHASRDIIALLTDLHAAQGKTVVVVTHDHAIAAQCPRRIEVVDGRIVSDFCREGDAQ